MIDATPTETGDMDSSVEVDARFEIDVTMPEPTRVLFIGNSYTSINDLPSVVRILGATTSRSTFEVETIESGGARLSDHWLNANTRARIEAGGFDVIVLQGQSSEPMLEGAAFDFYARLFADAVSDLGARAVWYATWARRDGDAFYDGPGFGSNPARMTAQIEGRYAWAAHWHDDVVARVGAAFQLAIAERPNVALYAEDGSHPTAAGTMLAACTIVQAITGRTPVLPEPAPLDLPQDIASALCSLVPQVRCLSDVMVPCDGIPGCINPFTDRANCGACGLACPGTLSCVRGECGCPLGLTACADECVDLQTDRQHCGTCEASCDDSDMPCHDGACLCPNIERRDVRFADLSAFNSECDSFSSPVPECAAAVHRYCASLDCYMGGFGPTMAPGIGLSAMCLRGDVQRITYAELEAFVPECDGSTERAGLNCGTAISRYCASIGTISGFGPVESAGDELTVICLPHATIIPTTLDALAATPFSGCDGPGPRWGFDCNHASWFLCTSLGHAAGFGPIEIAGNDANLVCVDR